MAEPSDVIRIRGARQHNLKNVSIDLPRGRFIVMTGVSGSGKSSLAFDTLYAEGQRRYIESLSAYARQFLGQMDKPDVDSIEGLSPAIAIQQRAGSRNPRSTVGTVTEIYDFLRLLYARIGVPHCPNDGNEIAPQSVDRIVESVETLAAGERVELIAPVGTLGEGRAPGRPGPVAPGGPPTPHHRRGRGAPPGGRGPPREEQEAHDRGDRRQLRGRSRRRNPTRGGRGADAPTRERTRHRAPREGRANDVLEPTRLSGVRVLGRGARAADVLLQQPVRSVPRMPRDRSDAARRPRTDRPQQGQADRKGDLGVGSDADDRRARTVLGDVRVRPPTPHSGTLGEGLEGPDVRERPEDGPHRLRSR